MDCRPIANDLSVVIWNVLFYFIDCNYCKSNSSELLINLFYSYSLLHASSVNIMFYSYSLLHASSVNIMFYSYSLLHASSVNIMFYSYSLLAC